MAKMGKTQRLPRHLSKTVAADFPSLKRNEYTVTSHEDPVYNCIAYAAGDTSQWWDFVEPPSPLGVFWPEGAGRDESLDALKSCFETIGYEVSDGSGLEDGYEKIALYVNKKGHWTHAARQERRGSWTSKLGKGLDISHETPQALYGDLYGEFGYYMKRRIADSEGDNP